MAKEQSNVSDLLPLLESSDLHELDQIKSVLNDHLGTGQYSKFSIIPPLFLLATQPQQVEIATRY